MVILGGSGSVTGAAIGGVFITFTIKAIELLQRRASCQDSASRPHRWLDLNALRMIIYAAVLVALMIWRPEGLLGERELFQKRSAQGAEPAERRRPPRRATRARGEGLSSALVLEHVSKNFGGLRAVGRRRRSP